LKLGSGRGLYQDIFSEFEPGYLKGSGCILDLLKLKRKAGFSEKSEHKIGEKKKSDRMTML
jgi:hypothetical protein